MAEEDIKQDGDPQGQSPTSPDPSQSQDGQSNDKPETLPAQDDLPEKFKGKTAVDIAKSYQELEKKLGEHDLTKKQLSQWQTLGKVIKSNPELEKQILAEIDKIEGKSSVASPEDRSKAPDDTRPALQNTIIGTFEKNFGIDRLPSEKKKDLFEKIATELGDIYDPDGRLSTAQVLNLIPLDRLPKVLEKVYKLATAGDEAEQNRLRGLLEARQNAEAMIGSIPSSGVKGGQPQLTPQQREVARKQGISEQDYIKQLREIEEGK